MVLYSKPETTRRVCVCDNRNNNNEKASHTIRTFFIGSYPKIEHNIFKERTQK